MSLLAKSAAFSLALAASSIASAAQKQPTHADVYYLRFDIETPGRVEERQLMEWSNHHTVVKEAKQLAELAQVLNTTCVPAPPGRGPRDLRLLVVFSGSESWSWKADQFYYSDSRTKLSCTFAPSLRAKLLATLGL